MDLKYNDLVRVSGVALPTPSKYSGEVSDLVDSGRNANGIVVSSIVRSNIGKVSLEWNFLSATQWSNVLKLFKNNFVNSVRFYDQIEGAFVTKNMYVSNRSSGELVTSDGIIKGWSHCKLSLIEV